MVKFYDKYRPSETVRLAHKLASQFVVAKPVKRDEAFHDQQQTFWKMVVKDENDNVVKTKRVNDKVCLTMDLRDSDKNRELNEIDAENWPDNAKNKSTVLSKIKQLLEL